MSKRWEIFKPAPEKIELISKSLSVSPITSSILISRGVTEVDRAREFLFGLKSLNDPFSISGMKEGATAIIESVERREKMLIFGDYDVDGITSMALLYDLLKRLGSKSVEYRIPLRGDGYGLNPEAVNEIVSSGCDLLLTVDNGIRSISEISALKATGIKVIVIDHHEPGPDLPDALLIDPKLDENEDVKNLAGVGVVFKLAQAIITLTEGQVSNGIHPWLRERLDLVALGTVADLVELKGENRYLVKEGLKVLDRCQRPGIKKLTRVAGIGKDPISAESIAFIIAPRLNASGRVSSAIKALHLLLTEDESYAESIAKELDELNSFRQKLEKKILEEACAIFEESYFDHPAIVLSSPEWHEGVVGIVASRMTERYHRPAILLCENEVIARGSARSVKNFDLYHALCENSSLLDSFGGHKLAAGLSLKLENVEVFREAFYSRVEAEISAEERIPVVPVDCIIDLSDIVPGLIAELELLEPFGYGNQRPVFALKGVRPERHSVVGKGKHFAFDLSTNDSIRGIAFAPPDIENLIGHDGLFDIAFNLRRDSWKGCERIGLRSVDILGVEPGSNSLVEKAFEEAEKSISPGATGRPSVKMERPARDEWGVERVIDRRNEKQKRHFLSQVLGEEPVFVFAHGKRNCIDIARWLRIRRPEFGDKVVPIFSGMPEKIGTQVKTAFDQFKMALVVSNESMNMKADLCKVALFSLPLTLAQFISTCSQNFGRSELFLLYNNGDLATNIELSQALFPGRAEIESVWEAIGEGMREETLIERIDFAGKYRKRRISSALAILKEAGLMKLAGNKIVPTGNEEVDFTHTESYIKGLKFRDEVESFGSWALGAGIDEIERVIATGQYGNKIFRGKGKEI